MSKTYAIIVAAGKGLRMQLETPKQYLPLEGIPVLARTIKKFDACPQISAILVVIPPGDQSFCRDHILSTIQTVKSIGLVEGGSTRQESVFKALGKILEKDAWVAIHDGVRPLIETEMITASINAAFSTGACILALPVSDTVKRVHREDRIEKTIDRSSLWFAQTPQVFRLDIIMAAHRQAQADGFNGSDDALLVERVGNDVTVVEGHKKNLKITTREDIRLAEFFLHMANQDDRK